MNQKGFANILLIVLVVVLAGVAGYFIVNQQAPSPVPTPSPIPSPNPTQTPSSTPTPSPTPTSQPTSALIQVTQITTDTKHSVSATNLATAKELFQKNNIEIGTLAIVEVVKDDHGITHIWGKQFYNGLPVFFGNIGYHFDQFGKAQDRSIIDGTNNIFTSGERIGDLGISTKPSISISTAAGKAHEKMKSKYVFVAELGVLDLNAGTSYAKPNFVLAWRVMPKGADKYPYADIDASNGSVLRYDDGIRY